MGDPALSSRLVGARLGAYELVRLIGDGSTASVFEGVHSVLGRKVAVKVLHEHLMRDDQIAARFLREGRVAARLQHPHVLEVIDLGHENGVAWLVMEHLEGRDLRQELVRRQRLPLEEVTALLLPIASALAYAHALGALHRDLKPANVFLARDELDRIVPKIVDFGLSKLAGLDEDHPLTETELVAGSVSYMAPEQTYGIAHAGAPADQFSFGAILYECVTGHAPFVAKTFYQLIERIRASHPKAPSEEIADLPTGLDAVVLRALAAAPADRWPTMRDVGAALLPFAETAVRSAWTGEFVESPDTVRTMVASPRGLRAAPRSRPFDVTRTSTEEELCPPLPCPPGKSPFTIKGLPYRGFVHLVEQALPGGVQDLVEALDDEALGAFVTQPFLASSRYDALPLRPLMACVALLVGRTFEQLVETASAAQSNYDMRRVFRQMFASATLDNWDDRLVRFGAQYHGFALLEAVREGPNVVVQRNVGVPVYLAPWYAAMQRGYSTSTVRALGGRDVVAETLPSEPCEPMSGLPTLTTFTRVSWTR
jgi:tRNA A-37 threonylcarbamoyl transferase component Bud32